jgi:hypothetical protein
MLLHGFLWPWYNSYNCCPILPHSKPNLCFCKAIIILCIPFDCRRKVVFGGGTQHSSKSINLELKKEAAYFGDIVIVPFLDHYDLVVLKTVAICDFGVIFLNFYFSDFELKLLSCDSIMCKLI